MNLGNYGHFAVLHAGSDLRKKNVALLKPRITFFHFRKPSPCGHVNFPILSPDCVHRHETYFEVAGEP